MNNEGRWLKIQAYKHNGELHRAWSHGFVLQENDDHIVLISVRASVVEHDGRKWHTREPAVFVFFKKEWLNVIAMLKEKDVSYYVNIASPAVIHKNIIKYIDYDLDVKVFTDGEKRLLDVDEYEVHKQEMDYSPDIDFILKENVKILVDWINNKKGPFSQAYINIWYKRYLELKNR